MTTREITRHLGLPAQTIRNWRQGSKQDWRYKLLMFLENKDISPDMVEAALTSLPELQAEEPSTTELIEEIKALQAKVQAIQEGTSDAKLRTKSRED